MTIKQLFRRWLERRTQRRSEYLLTQKNIYIFPSKQGFFFLLMLLVMLITAINYQSSLIYLFVFMLGGVFAVSIWLCFFNMQGLTLRLSEMLPVEAGEKVTVNVVADTAGKQRSGFYAAFEVGPESIWRMEQSFDVKVQTQSFERGVHSLSGIRLQTYFPFGLVRAWTWMWFDEAVYVYPRPLPSPEHTSLARNAVSGSGQVSGQELDNVKAYDKGDNVRRILWKHFAKRDELIVRSPELLSADPVHLEYDSYTHFGKELALSYLCFDVFELHESRLPFSLSLPNVRVGEEQGELHLRRCLRALAECA